MLRGLRTSSRVVQVAVVRLTPRITNALLTLERCAVDRPHLDNPAEIVFLKAQADLLCHATGGVVLGMDDRDEVGCLQNVTSKVAARCCRFGCVAVLLHVRPNVVADFEFGPSIH
jgi:hypothetical protein